MMNEELLTEILIQMQRRYQILNEVFRQTAEIGDTLSRDDRVSAQLLLEMRQEELERLSENEGNIRRLLECVSGGEQEELWALIRAEGERSNGEGFERAKIRDIAGQISNLRRRLVESDRAVSRKLAGADSFYKK